jgi:hypothetical protein
MKIEISGSPGQWQLYQFVSGSWINIQPDVFYQTKKLAKEALDRLNDAYDGFTVLPVGGVATDFNDWNDIQNKFNSRTYVPKRRRVNRRLLTSVIKEFREFCKSYHIDASKYRFIEPAELEGEIRQFDFMDSMEKDAAKISIHSIISKGGKIYQRIIDIGG